MAKDTPNGLKTAVKWGHMTPYEAFKELHERWKVSGYLSKRLVAWLTRRISKT